MPSAPRRPLRLRSGLYALAALLVLGMLMVWYGLGGFQDVTLPGDRAGVHVLDRNDKPVVVLLEDKELIPVPLSRISKWMRQAIVASEDRNFYYHNGVDPVGMTRAVLADAQARRFVQGGSTITEQLAKNLFFMQQPRNLLTKLREMLVAIQLEQRYSKDKILEAYLNNVYFGEGTFGIERASERYFGKSAAGLSLSESAYLAGLVNAPSHLAADKHDARIRQHMILETMGKIGMVSPALALAAERGKLTLRSQPGVAEHVSYYVAYLKVLLESRFSKEQLYRKGVTVYSNLDIAAQSLADTVLSNGIKHAPKGINQGALVSLSVNDGSVLAIVGGAGSFLQSPWDRALSPHTAGSAFKPLVYLAALRAGLIQPDTMVEDAPLAVPVNGSQIYAPKNFDNRYMGPITVRMALALSRNTCAVRIAQAVGPDKVVETARLAGITSRLDPTLSIALGAYAVSPLEMASAYSTLARGGVWMEPRFIRQIQGADGSILYCSQAQGKQVFEQEPVAELVDVLEDVVEKGTGTHAQLYDRPVAGKTGTADGARDIWFIGFTPDIVTAVWGGNDQNNPVKGQLVTGGSVMAGIWQDYMESYYKKVPTPPGSFIQPMTPLIQESEPLHFLPQPAGIFQKIMRWLEPEQPIPVAPDRQTYMQAPRLAPDRHAQRQEYAQHKTSKKPSGIKSFFKKMLNVFN